MAKSLKGKSLKAMRARMAHARRARKLHPKKSRKRHATAKGHVPLNILERRLVKLNRTVAKRGGHHY